MDNLATTISVIVAICAIISPIFVALVTNHHNIKMKKLEMSQAHRLKALEDFVTAAYKYNKHNGGADEEKYENTLGPALLYTSDTTRNYIIEIDNLFEVKYKNHTCPEETDNEIKQKLKQLTSLLQKEININ